MPSAASITTAQDVARYFSYLLSDIVLVWTVLSLDIYWPWVWDSPAEIADLLGRMYPPDFRRSGEILRVLLETINIATLATLLSLFIAIPTAYISARNISPHPLLVWVGRFILVSSRSVNTIIWALLFVAKIGRASCRERVWVRGGVRQHRQRREHRRREREHDTRPR